MVGLSKKHSKSKHKYQPNLQSTFHQKYNTVKQYKKSSVYKPSLKQAIDSIKVRPTKFSESRQPALSEGNLLQQYKRAINYNNLPTNRELAWDRFLDGLNQLPAELQIKFTQELDYLRYTYGDQAVAYYLDKHSLLGEMSKFSSVDYKSTIAIMYLYKLARGLELATQGDISDNHFDLRSEAEWSINKTVREKNRSRYELLISDEAIQDINLTIELDKYVDSLWDDAD